jgi:tetratricopeptide (TPR) repeat protein
MPRLVLLGTLLFTSAAFAQDDAARLAVVGLHQPDLSPEQQAAAISALTEAVDVSGKADGLETDLVAEAIRGREEIILQEALLANGRADLLNGKNAYNQASTDEAITNLQSAVESLSVAVAATNDTKDLWEAWVYLGTAHLQAENEMAAQISYRAAVALNPDRSPNPATFPPDVTALYETQRALLKLSAIPVTIQIEGEGEADISMDSIERGAAPVTIEGVLPGMHHVVAKGDGTYAHQLVRVEQVEAENGPVVVLQPGPPQIGASAETTLQRSRQITGLYRALGAHAKDVDLVLLAGTVDEQLHLQLYAPAADAFSRAIVVPYQDDAVDEAAAAMPELMTLVTNDGKLPSDAVAALAAPLQLHSNSHLARMLMDPSAAALLVDTTLESPTKKRSPVVPIVVGILAASAAGTGGYLGYNALRGDTGTYGGSISVGPF